MKTMIKSTLMLATLLVVFTAHAQNSPPQEPPDQPVPSERDLPERDEPEPPAENPFPVPPAELIEQLRQANGSTNGVPEEVVNELIRALIEARSQNGNQPPESDARPGESPRPLRGQSTRGTTGSPNSIPLSSLVTNGNSHVAPGATNGLRLNFRNAPLSLVLDYLSDAAGFTISANSKVDLKGNVTVWSNRLVDRNEAVALLNSALTSSGYGATVDGNLLNIYVVDATTTPIEVGIPDNDYRNIPATKDLVTQIVYVHNVEANQLIQSLQPLMPAGTSMSANQGANAIILTDTRANIRRMVQLVKALDTASTSAAGVEVFPLTFADATSLAQVITQLFQTESSSNRGDRRFFFGGGFPGGGDRGRGDSSSTTQAGRMAVPKVTAVADERSNSLVVSASEDQMKAIRELVSQMDVAVDDLTEIRVFRLRNADPQETADQLTSLFTDSNSQQTSRSQQFGFRGFWGGGDRDRDRSRSGSNNQNDRSAKQLRVTAVADPRTGSVIVSASHALMDQIAGIIDELDSDSSKKKKVYVIKVENQDPAEVVEALQAVIAPDTSGNFSNNRNSRDRGSQLSNRQQNSIQNQGNTSRGFGSSFGTGGARSGRTGR